MRYASLGQEQLEEGWRHLRGLDQQHHHHRHHGIYSSPWDPLLSLNMHSRHGHHGACCSPAQLELARPQVDSILIDEARTPLIISGPSDKPSDKYYKVRLAMSGTCSVRCALERMLAHICSTHSLCYNPNRPTNQPTNRPTNTQAAKIADALTRDVHYTVDEKQKSVLLTEDGWVGNAGL